MNKVNPRKEFFRLKLDDVKKEIDLLGIQAQWTMTALASDYRETLRIEQKIVESQEAEREWTRNQLSFEPDTAAIDE